jgi:hypothetical protein
MRRSDVVPMRWMVIHEYEVNYPDHETMVTMGIFPFKEKSPW